MKYHFIYPDVSTFYLPSLHHGIAQLSSFLKTNGHETSLSHITKDINKKELHRMINDAKPDYVCFTTMSNQFKFVKLWSSWIKEKYDVPIVCGGVHATLNPEEVLNHKDIDYVCVGEGEYPLIENNFWRKNNGEIIKGKSYPFIKELDELPFPDYDLFDCDRMLKINGGNFPVIVSRGCPYNCFNCTNHALRKTQEGNYFRFRSVDNTLEMLDILKQKYKIKNFSFADDIFGINKEWVYEFCEKYPQRIRLSFDCNLRIEMVDEKLLQSLKKAGCKKIELGIESGNEWIRQKMLNRNMTNEQIIDVFDMAHKIGLKTRAYNMVGLPYENVKMIEETIELNKQVKPDQVAVFYFYPFKGTKLYDICKENDLLNDKENTNYITESVLDLPNISQYDLRRKYNEFYKYVIEREMTNFSIPIKIVAKIIRLFIGLFTLNNDAVIFRNLYLKLSPLINRLRGV